uniref:Globin n=1 Tax=Chlamydomonas leiostraca TaxID=1034604 RepID=A0A7S0S7R2_9CHLO|mmetsp:Transcript_9685/g.24052  ORF Transcript_9685/g.24052 Transcript_9685/m.24052 type:complete len:894 (+) Transcript_9685:158-2839(+)
MPAGNGLWDGQEQTLLSRLGGFTVLTRVVDDFYARLLSDEQLSPFFQGHSLERLHEKQVKFCSFAFGGSSQYFGRDIAYTHRDMIMNKGLNLTHFDRLIKHFGDACEACGLPADCAAEAKMILGATRPIFDPKRYKKAIPNAEEQNRELRATLAAMKAPSSSSSDPASAGQLQALPGVGAAAAGGASTSAAPAPAACPHRLQSPDLPGTGASGSSEGCPARGQLGFASEGGHAGASRKKPALKLSQLAKVLAPALQQQAAKQSSPTAVPATSSGIVPLPASAAGKSLTRRDKLNMLLSLLKPEDGAGGSSAPADGSKSPGITVRRHQPQAGGRASALQSMVARKGAGDDSSDDGDSYLPDSEDSIPQSDSSSAHGGRAGLWPLNRRSKGPPNGGQQSSGDSPATVGPSPPSATARLSTVLEQVHEEHLSAVTHSSDSQSLKGRGSTSAALQPAMGPGSQVLVAHLLAKEPEAADTQAPPPLPPPAVRAASQPASDGSGLTKPVLDRFAALQAEQRSHTTPQLVIDDEPLVAGAKLQGSSNPGGGVPRARALLGGQPEPDAYAQFELSEGASPRCPFAKLADAMHSAGGRRRSGMVTDPEHIGAPSVGARTLLNTMRLSMLSSGADILSVPGFAAAMNTRSTQASRRASGTNTGSLNTRMNSSDFGTTADDVAMAAAAELRATVIGHERYPDTADMFDGGSRLRRAATSGLEGSADHANGPSMGSYGAAGYSHTSSFADGATKSLYDKLGSTEAIQRCVSVFVSKLMGDAALAPFFQGVDFQHLSHKQAVFFAFIFGGASEYQGKDIAAAHGGLVRKGLTLDHFDRFASHFVDALIECGVASHHIDEATMVLLTMRHLFDPASILELEAAAHDEAAQRAAAAELLHDQEQEPGQ